MSTHSDHRIDDATDLLVLRDQLDDEERQSAATAAAWREWAAELVALAARMPGLPQRLDVDGVESHTVERAGIAPTTLRTALAAPVRAADHFAAVYARHAAELGDALAEVLAQIGTPATTAGADR